MNTRAKEKEGRMSTMELMCFSRAKRMKNHILGK